ncbi:MAG: hypothetical protein AAGL49_08870 [Pseudomonadota bacterium]
MVRQLAERGARALAIASLCLGLAACTVLGIPAAGDKPNGPAAEPPITISQAKPTTGEEWRTENAAGIKSAFERNVYGPFPGPTEIELAERRVIDNAAYDGAGVLEELSFRLRAPNGEAIGLRVALATPTAVTGPVPVILAANFCGNRATMGREDVSPPQGWYPGMCDGGWAEPLVKFVFGKHISTPPLADILRRGYAIGTFYPGEVAPENVHAHMATALGPASSEDANR